MIIPWVPLYREGGFIISCGAWNRTDLKGFSKPFIESILAVGSLDYSILQPSQNANHVCSCQDVRLFWVVCDRCSELTDSPTSDLCWYIHTLPVAEKVSWSPYIVYVYEYVYSRISLVLNERCYVWKKGGLQLCYFYLIYIQFWYRYYLHEQGLRQCVW